jgi:hypothetical protein
MKTIAEAKSELKWAQLYHPARVDKAKQELQEAQGRHKWRLLYGSVPA